MIMRGNREISNSDKVIDSRDVIERIQYLEDERDQIEDEEEREAWTEDDEGKELAALKALADEAEGCGDWAHGETLIADSYFTEYAEELASDIGVYDPHNVRWPYTCIDWENAADELKQDYTRVDFDGETYWIRG